MVENQKHRDWWEIGKSYDEEAGRYDALYQRVLDIAEDQVAAEWLGSHRAFDGHVLDVGCGTGKAHELARRAGTIMPPSRYVGIDASLGMVARAKERFPHHHWTQGPAELLTGIAEWERRFDNALCLFESWNYLRQPLAAMAIAWTMKPGAWLYIIAAGPATRVQRRPIGVTRPEPVRHRALLDTLSEAGFSQTEVTGMTSPLADLFDAMQVTLSPKRMADYLRSEQRWMPRGLMYWQMIRTRRWGW